MGRKWSGFWRGSQERAGALWGPKMPSKSRHVVSENNEKNKCTNLIMKLRYNCLLISIENF